MRLLITGGNGLLARALMQAMGDTVTVRALDAVFGGDLPPNIEGIEGDLRDPETVRRALEGVNAVVHLAGLYPVTTTDAEFETDNDILDQATRGTYVLLTEMHRAGVKRLVLGSTLRLFDALPAAFQVDERWRPRPDTFPEFLAPWLMELSAREAVRVSVIRAACVRLGNITDREDKKIWMGASLVTHIHDAVEGVCRALDWTARAETSPLWRVFHITPNESEAKIQLSNWTQQTLGYEPQHRFSPASVGDADLSSLDEEEYSVPPQTRSYRTAKAWIPSRPIHRVVIFGAGGPVAAALAEELAGSYRLRLTDARPLDEIACENHPQSPGAPVARPLPAPHEHRIVDVRDPIAVMDACEGMDAIINCSVVRHDAVEAFRVNTLGAHNIMQAAVAHNIRRVVQTGPQMVDINEGIGYSWDDEVPGDAPPRPGMSLYFHSKYLGQEICRVFADNYGLEVPVLLFCLFFNPEVTTGINDFCISWQDSARAIRAALETPSLPSPYEVMNILADLPQSRYSNARAKALLHWQPRDDFRWFWDREKR